MRRRAYTQAKLGTGLKTSIEENWVEILIEQQPQSWKDTGIVRPCCPLRISLYGHPLSGTFWENQYTEKIINGGFVKMMGWECFFYHEELKVILSIYVDDFKLCGLTENLKNAANS